MSALRLWLVTVLCCTVLRLHAQALPTAAGGGSYLAVGGGFTGMRMQYGQRTVGGGVAYAESNLTPHIGLEYEGRFLRLNNDESVTQSTYLAGARYSLRNYRLQPYVKVLGGLGRMSFPFHYATGEYFVVAPGAGVDYHLNDRWTVRAIDVEYQHWTSFTYGGLSPYGVSAGLSFRLNGIELFPKKMRHRN
jgi:hypothetical protein